MFSFQNSCRPCNALQLCGDLRQSKQLCYMDVQHNMNGLAEIDSGAGSFHSNLVHEPYPPFQYLGTIEAQMALDQEISHQKYRSCNSITVSRYYRVIECEKWLRRLFFKVFKQACKVWSYTSLLLYVFIYITMQLAIRPETWLTILQSRVHDMCCLVLSFITRDFVPLCPFFPVPKCHYSTGVRFKALM